jgi:hypothetical protein
MRSPDKVESRHRLPLSTPMAHGRFTKWPSTPLSALPRWYLQGIPNQQVKDGSDFAPVLTKTKQWVILCRSTKAWSCWAKGFFLFEPLGGAWSQRSCKRQDTWGWELGTSGGRDILLLNTSYLQQSVTAASFKLCKFPQCPMLRLCRDSQARTVFSFYSILCGFWNIF